jgi:serine/threonine protein kinase
VTSDEVVWNYDPTFEQRYQLIDKIGSGGFGTVFKAKRVANGKEMAIKFLRIPRGEEEQYMKYINEEVRLMRETRNANNQCESGIVCYVEHFAIPVQNDIPAYVIVMELLQGRDLFDISSAAILNNQPIQEETIRKWLASALDALAKLHAKGIAHRDIKRENLYVIENEDKVVLIDLGVGCFTDLPSRRRLTPRCQETTDILGTPCSTMAPEIATRSPAIANVAVNYTDDKVTLSADVFAMALAFWPLLQMPRRDCQNNDDGMQQIASMANFKRPELDAFNHIQNPVLKQVFYDMLAEKAQDRPTAAEARNRLLVAE